MPDVPEFPKVPIPPARHIKVGTGWNAGIDWQYTGLRDVMIDGFGGDGCIGHRQIVSKGEPRIIMDVNTGPEFSIDPEGAALFMMFEMERYVAEWYGSNARKPLAMEGHHVVGVEYRTYVSYGFLSVAKGQEAKVDEILRRTAWRERLGLAGYQYEHERALAMSVEASVPEVPSQEEVEAGRRAKVARTRRIKRDALQQKRINLQQLYTEWAPDVPWRHMVKNGQIPMVALPRNRKGRLVLRHLITPYRLADFLSNNPFVVTRVRAHRGKKQVGQTLDLFQLAA